MSSHKSDPVTVIVGAGGIGAAIARRVGAGTRLVLGDRDMVSLAALTTLLKGEGHDVVMSQVDVTSEESVADFAGWAATQGDLQSVVHTAGVSPAGTSVDAILRVDLLGTALVLDAFASLVAIGGSGVFIASMAGHLAGAVGADVELALSSTPTAELLALPYLAEKSVTDNPAWAYMLAKRGNQLRVKAMSHTWGQRRATVNSISPGVISTPMGRAELESDSGAAMRELIDGSSTGRIGTPEDIAAAAEFLLGPQASFITGTDLLVDGGVVASVT